jgi:hypothetical protein
MPKSRAILLALCATLSTVYGWAQPQYSVTDLGLFRPRDIADVWIAGAIRHGTLDEPVRLHFPTMTTLSLQHLGYGGEAFMVLDNARTSGLVWVADGGTPPVLTAREAFWDASGRLTLSGVGFTDPTRLSRAPVLLPGFDACWTREANALGDAAGFCVQSTSVPETAPHRAALWPEEGGVIDLNTAIAPMPWVLTDAVGLDHHGLILAWASSNGTLDPRVEARYFLLTPLAPPDPLSITLHLNQQTFHPSDTLRMSIEVRSPGPPEVTTNVYIGLLMPNGVTTWWYTQGGFQGPTPFAGDPRTFWVYQSLVHWPAGRTTWDLWAFPLTGGEVSGVYHVIVALVKAETNDDRSIYDGRIDEGDIVSLDWEAIHIQGSSP